MGAVEERLNPSRLGQANPDVRVEKHKAGERCRHWKAGPHGEPSFETVPNACILCYGTGKLIVDVNLRFHRKKKTQLHTFYPSELPDTEYMPSSARKPYEQPQYGRRVA